MRRRSIQDLKEFMPKVALKYLSEGKKVALATVVSTWGSAPRGVGSQLAISEDGEFEGSVSGGCVEGAVIVEALDAMIDGECKLLEYGVADEDAFAVGLACGGDIKILVEPVDIGSGLKSDALETMVASFVDRKTIGYSISLSVFERSLLSNVGDQTGIIGDRFYLTYIPSPRLVIVGAVHITKTLSSIAKMAGYDVYLVDPRESFASSARFPEDTFLEGWSDEALRDLGVDANTAIVTLSHDPKIDTPALEVALKSDAFYIGSLGSKKTHGKRVAQLKSLGFSEALIDRIHSPIGLNIGSKTPPEIAISIMAEITQVFHAYRTRESS
ncbi:MAG: XdhC family protein [Lentilitoribacter sp.]